MKEIQSLLFVLLAAVLWGTTGTAQEFAPDGAHPIAFGAMRLIIGGIVLYLIALLTGQRNLATSKFLIFIAAISMALYQPFFFTAVKLTGIAVGTVIAIGSAPIITGLIEWVTLHRKPQINWWKATFLAIIGSILLLAGQQSITIQPLGMFLALGAGFTFALYTITSKKILSNNSPLLTVAIIFSLSGCLLVPSLFFLDLTWLAEGNGLATTLYLGLFATALAYMLFSKGLQKIPASTGVTLSLAEPLTAALLGTLLIGQPLPFIGWIGILLIFISILLLSSSGKRKHKKVS